MKKARDKFASAIEALLEWGGMKRDIAFLILSGIALVVSLAVPDGLR